MGTPIENFKLERLPPRQNSILYFQHVKKNSHCKSVISISFALLVFSIRVFSRGTKKVGTNIPLAWRSSYSISRDCLVSSSVSPGKPIMKVQNGNQLWRFRISMPLTTTSRHWCALYGYALPFIYVLKSLGLPVSRPIIGSATRLSGSVESL